MQGRWQSNLSSNIWQSRSVVSALRPGLEARLHRPNSLSRNEPRAATLQAVRAATGFAGPPVRNVRTPTSGGCELPVAVQVSSRAYESGTKPSTTYSRVGCLG